MARDVAAPFPYICADQIHFCQSFPVFMDLAVYSVGVDANAGD
jgi:hypothetical protein